MDPSLLNQVIVAAATLLASVGGYWLAGRNEGRRDERTRQRELELRQSERDAVADQASSQTQRETLLALQEALQKTARFASRMLMFDHENAKVGKYTNLPNGLSEEEFANRVEVALLRQRILDSSVRDAIGTFTDLIARLTLSPMDLHGLTGSALEARAESKMLQLMESYESLSAVLGEALRRELSWRPGARRTRSLTS